MGIPAKLYMKSQPSRYEKAIYYSMRLPYELRCVLAGTMKAARLSKHYENEHLQTIHEVSTNIIGPFLFCYVYWIFKNASKMGLERLYFLSRDGQILKSIADILVDAFKIRIETRYLFVSRKALYLPSLIVKNDIDEMLKLSRPLALEDIFKALGLAKEECYSKFSPSDLKCLKERILEIAERKRRILLEYLRQEGFNKNVRIGIVDVGWKGLLQYALSKVLDYGGLYNSSYGITGFYVGLDLINVAPVYKSDRRLCFFKNDKHYHVLGYAALYEIFTGATHGLTLGYRKEGKIIKPVLKSEKNTELLKWGLKVQQDSIIHFAKLFAKNVMKYEVKLTNFQDVAETLLSLFLNSPRKAEARAYGSAIHRPDIEENEPYYIAPPLKLTYIVPFLFQKIKIKFLTLKAKPLSLWIEGSVVTSFSDTLAKLLIFFLNLRKKILVLIRTRY